MSAVSRAYLDDAIRQKIEAAARAVENSSAAELVVAIRPWSGSYLHADLAAALAAGAAVLAFVVFSPWPFHDWMLFVYPVVGAALAALTTSRTPTLRRWLSPRRLREAQVRTAAHALFQAREVGLTRRRTGVLVYASRLEGLVIVLADRAAQDALGVEAWRERTLELQAALAHGRSAAPFALALARLTEPLARALPRQADDQNELPDAIDVV